MKKIVRISESDLIRLLKKVISEQNPEDKNLPTDTETLESCSRYGFGTIPDFAKNGFQGTSDCLNIYHVLGRNSVQLRDYDPDPLNANLEQTLQSFIDKSIIKRCSKEMNVDISKANKYVDCLIKSFGSPYASDEMY
jgi:hypothetical protein